MRRVAISVVLALGLSLAALAGPAVTAAPAAPSCAEGPQTVGETIVGTPCDDTIHAPRGITAVYGEGGNDSLFGGRGNDSLFGGEGDDRLYGGIGDDRLRGGPGNDLLSGGFGADSLDGEAGDDYARGDATVDRIGDSGPASDTDTLSFATGVTPGFPNEGSAFAYAGFPNDGKEDGAGRGVFIEMTKDFANDGLAPSGGGVDKPLEAASFESFERVVGTPFSDFIVGTAGAESIDGGGGADVILGEGGGDLIDGGAEGDYCDGAGAGGSTASCEFTGSAKEVTPRSPSQASAGLTIAAGIPPALYLAGSTAGDEVDVTYASGQVSFELGGGSSFDPGSVAAGGCSVVTPTEAACPVPEAPDSIVLAGLEGDDALSAAGLPIAVSPIVLGGEGNDALIGGDTEDALIDGAGNDSVSAAGGDDAVPNNGGSDDLHAGAGDDLFISNEVCEGDVLDGGEGSDNANWANFGAAVALDLGTGLAGLVGPEGHPACASGSPTGLEGLEDIEGSNGADSLIGDAGPNQLLGRPGADSYHAAAGNDSILANSGDSDSVIDCGDGFDTAQIDIPTAEYADPTPVDCEAIHERPPNSFRPPDTPPAPAEEAAEPPPLTSIPLPGPGTTSRRDRTPPITSILHRPPRLVFSVHRRRRVSFSFASNEPGSTFSCGLDRAPFLPCRSPRAYRLRRGRHAFRVFAVDPAGNRDRSPALFRFRIRRR